MDPSILHLYDPLSLTTDAFIAETSPPNAEASSSSQAPAATSSTRAKTGCITCRLRKKRCDEGKPKCAACARLGIECLGYGAKRPKWLKDENNAKRTKLEIKERVSQRRASKKKEKSVEPPADDTNAIAVTTTSLATVPPYNAPFNFINDPELDDVWRLLFGQDQPASTPFDPFNPFIPDPSAGLAITVPGQNYLHHYLNVVMPLQYRFTGSMSIGDLVAPLAMARHEVLTSVSSLAALHMSVKRNKTVDPTAFLAALDNDGIVAINSHQETIERLRFISSTDFTAEDIIVSAMFAVSYHTFMGGTSKEWKEVLAISQRCLSAALASSPELTGGRSNPMVPSPWQRYRQLIEVMVWMDIIASVSNNKGTRLLPIYRNLLGHLPVMSTTHPKLSMERVMGGDSTTLLALAETVALSEWKERAEEAGFCNLEQLKQRAAPIEKLLQERAWRESHFDEAPVPIMMPDGTIRTESEEEGKMRVMSDVFYGAATLFLASIVHGPNPRASDVAAGVQDVIEALHRLDILHPNPDINRAVIFPITLAGCLCETLSQQAFFRGRFQQLSPEATAFGNTRPALELMEEVWTRRLLGGVVHWRHVMLQKWEAGILLI